jgi:hypothetical protein
MRDVLSLRPGPPGLPPARARTHGPAPRRPRGTAAPRSAADQAGGRGTRRRAATTARHRAPAARSATPTRRRPAPPSRPAPATRPTQGTGSLPRAARPPPEPPRARPRPSTPPVAARPRRRRGTASRGPRAGACAAGSAPVPRPTGTRRSPATLRSCSTPPGLPGPDGAASDRGASVSSRRPTGNHRAGPGSAVRPFPARRAARPVRGGSGSRRTTRGRAAAPCPRRPPRPGRRDAPGASRPGRARRASPHAGRVPHRSAPRRGAGPPCRALDLGGRALRTARRRAPARRADASCRLPIALRATPDRRVPAARSSWVSSAEISSQRATNAGSVSVRPRSCGLGSGGENTIRAKDRTIMDAWQDTRSQPPLHPIPAFDIVDGCPGGEGWNGYRPGY